MAREEVSALQEAEKDPRGHHSVEFSPIMLVFHEEQIDEQRLKAQTPHIEYRKRLELAERAKKAAAASAEARSKAAAERRDREEFERLRKKFEGGR